MTTDTTQTTAGAPVRSEVLLGQCVAVPALSGTGRWWMTIIAISDCGRFLKVQSFGRGRAAGRARWVAANSVSTKTSYSPNNREKDNHDGVGKENE